jgi:hypothetical protein
MTLNLLQNENVINLSEFLAIKAWKSRKKIEQLIASKKEV